MIERIRVARWAVIGGIVLTVGVAGAATKLKRPTTGDACLCTPDTQERPAFATAPRGGGMSDALARVATVGTTTAQGTAGPLPAGYAATNGAASLGRLTSAAANGGTVSWGGSWRGMGAYSSSSSGRSANLGGLWRLMSWGRHRAVEHSVSTTRQVSTQPRRTSGGGGSSRPPASHSPGVAPAPPTGLFGEQNTPIASLLGTGGSVPGIGGSGTSGTGQGPGLAATPEPGSMVLLGTGLIGLVGVFRRRRA